MERARDRMSKDQNRDEEAFGRLDDALSCVNSAKELQLERLASHPMKFIISHYTILTDNNHKLPMIHLIMICKVNCRGQDNVSITLWSCALNPLKKLEDTKFDVQSACYADSNGLRMNVNIQEYKKFIEFWVSSAMNNTFWRMLSSIAEASTRHQFIEMCTAVLDMLGGIDFEDLLGPDINVEEAVMPIKAVERCYKGLLALASPCPCLATLSDVQYIMPANATTAPINNDVPRLGRSLVSTLRKDKGSFWATALEEYQATIGFAEQCLPAFKKLDRALNQQCDDLPELISEDVAAGFDDLATQCPVVVSVSVPMLR